jgi:hypothetical protein
MAFENILITEIQEQTIKDRAPDKMPLNPTAQGWSGQEVRRQLSRATFDNTNSVFAELKSKLTIIKSYFDENQVTIDEMLSDIADLQDAASLKINFYGKASQAITKGDILMFAGVQGDHILFAKANVNSVGFIPEYIVGVADSNMVQGDFGYARWFGKVEGIAINEVPGTLLWVGQTAGTYTTTKPASGVKILVAVVEKQRTGNASNGIILVRPTLGSYIGDLHDVTVQNVGDKHILRYNADTNHFENVLSNKVVVSQDAPSNNKDGDLWFDI